MEKNKYLDDFSNEIDNVDNQMSLSCGQDDPLHILKNSFFSSFIDIYFSPFFFELTAVKPWSW